MHSLYYRALDISGVITECETLRAQQYTDTFNTFTCYLSDTGDKNDVLSLM